MLLNRAQWGMLEEIERLEKKKSQTKRKEIIHENNRY